ncbi:MAG: hypothetical protein HQ580_14455 [Planctomycetes bacterium]|nr:hypothetical protein [Planctomycetota bacterium]
MSVVSVFVCPRSTFAASLPRIARVPVAVVRRRSYGTKTSTFARLLASALHSTTEAIVNRR